jgi:NADPH-dependent glutamate synthase beta subunit-like oxidoreductase
MWRDLNLEQIDLDFLTFLGDKSEVLKQKRLAENPLSSAEILEFAKKLEDFFIFKFNINLDAIYRKAEILKQKALVKRDFVQRKVKAHFNNFEGDLPPPLTEDEFVSNVLDLENEEEMINYARFVLFTKEGRERHKSDAVFKIPQKNQLPFESTTNEVIYKGESDFYKTEEQNFLDTKYCIYCHKQKRDYCRTHNPISQISGCPLDQKISEMNMLKAEGLVIAPLAVIMIDNPLCILTGHRICNDCKKSCIFQNQTPVDVPSIETQILMDVLNLPFGFEIYFLLTEWNPLLTKNFLPKEANGKRILVCGAGPAGILSSYYFLREGFNVLLVDGLKLKRLNITKIIENAPSILNKYIRNNKGFGGVMEYGITDRWNKNFLILAQILLERKEGFDILGGKKFGTDITFKWAKEEGFSHTLMCVGAGMPKLPEISFTKTYNIITASNFLMSAHLNEGWIEKNIKSPVLIIGGGLTAFDCALLSVKNGFETYLITRGNLDESRAFKGNSLEVEDALANGVKIFENRELEEITEGKFCVFLNKKTGQKEVFNFKLLVFAVGTKPNLDSIKDEEDDGFFTILGDLDKNYEGSVVKAFASIKNKKDEIIKKILNYEGKSSKLIINKDEIVKKEVLLGGVLKLQIKPSLMPINANIFDVYKLQILNTNLHPVPLTLFDFTENTLTFYVNQRGEGTKKLFEENCEILLTKVNSNFYNFKKVVVEDENLLMINNSVLLKDFNDEGAESTLFYINDVNKIKHFNSSKYYVFLFTEMNCSLSGVCSRCLTQKKDGSFFYACKQNIIPLNDL